MDAIRLATAADGEAVAAIYAPAVATATSFELEAPSAGEMARRIESTLPATPWIVFARGGDVAGYACASPHRGRAAYRWSVEVSVYVGAAHRRRGFARALYTSLFAVLRLQGYVNAYAGITLPNPASEGLHRALGFTLVGVYRGIGFKAGRWRDVAWFERPLRDRPADPEDPRPLTDFAGTAAISAALAAGIAERRRGGG